MESIVKIAIPILAFNVFLSGCVSVSTFDKQKEILDNCREQLHKDTKSYQDEIYELETNLEKVKNERSDLEGELETAKEERNKCHKDYIQVKAYAQDIDKRANELRHTLQKEILDRNVEIETLKGKLSVRVLDRILFKSGSAEILPDGKDLLNKLAAPLLSVQDYIRIEGHTDFVPIGKKLKEKFYSNWELSAARAASVVRFFQYNHKISPLRLEAVGFSKYRPVAQGKTDDELQRNRRVDIILTQPRD